MTPDTSLEATSPAAPELDRDRSPPARRAPVSRDAVATAIFLACAVGLGLAVRALLVLASDFPLGDGGLFYVMAQNLQAHGFVPPRTTTYNHGHIPFAYPPLGIYAVALLHAAGAPLLQIFRFFPLLVSTLTIGAFWLLARALLRNTVAAVAAVFAFALLPDAFHWEIQGGGVTRAPGELFAILALWQAVELFCHATRLRHAVLGAVFGALTVLSHPDWAWFLAYSLLLLWLAFGRTRERTLYAAVLAGGMLVLSAPWWLVVLGRYGVSTVLAAFSGTAAVWPWYNGLEALLQLRLTDEIGFPVLSALAAVGALSCLARRRYFLPIWLCTVLVLSSRAPTERAGVVVALLVGVGIADAVLPLLSRGRPGSVAAARPGRLAAIVLAVLLLRTVVTAWAREDLVTFSLPRSQRAATSWVARSTPPGSRFAVIGSVPWPSGDYEAEWFPALTGRVSVNTVQGYEWVPGAFARRYQADLAIERCATRSARCVLAWLRRHGWGRYVYVSRGNGTAAGDCCAPLRRSIGHDPRFVAVYHGKGATVWSVVRTPGAAGR